MIITKGNVDTECAAYYLTFGDVLLINSADVDKPTQYRI